MVMPTVPPAFSHKLYLPVVACASSDGSGGPSLDIPTMNLASARVMYRFNSQQVAAHFGSPEAAKAFPFTTIDQFRASALFDPICLRGSTTEPQALG